MGRERVNSLGRSATLFFSFGPCFRLPTGVRTPPKLKKASRRTQGSIRKGWRLLAIGLISAATVCRMHSVLNRIPRSMHPSHKYAAAVPLVALVATAAFPSASTAQTPIVDFSFFQEALSPYGDWVEVRGYGACWHPYVENEWTPYTDGFWAYTDAGWTWVSHEPFGSIVFHYGRWLLTSAGWCWVPGSDWAPAWVSWRASEEHIGWAPLPPEVPWDNQRGISSWVDLHSEIGPAYYRFCAVQDFCAPNLIEVLFRPTRNLNVMLQTSNITSISYRNNAIFCGGPEYRWIMAYTASPVPVLRLAREENIQRYYSLNIAGNFGTVQNFVYQGMLFLPAPQRVNLNNMNRHGHAGLADISTSKGWYAESAGNDRLRSHYNREWEERQLIQQRNPSAFTFQGPEVRVKPVSSTERRSVVSEVSARGQTVNPPSVRVNNPAAYSPNLTQPYPSAGARALPNGGDLPAVPQSTQVGAVGNRDRSPSEAPVGKRSVSPGPTPGRAVGAAGLFSAEPSALPPQPQTFPQQQPQGMAPSVQPPSTRGQSSLSGRGITSPDPAAPSQIGHMESIRPQVLPRAGALEAAEAVSPDRSARSQKAGSPSVTVSGTDVGDGSLEEVRPSTRSNSSFGTRSSQGSGQTVKPAPVYVSPQPALPQSIPAQSQPQPQGLSGSRSSNFGGSVSKQSPTQAPVSGARSTVIPASPVQPLPPTTSVPPTSGSQRGGVSSQGAAQGSQGAPSGSAARGGGGQPASTSQQAPSSGAGLSTVPNSGSAAQPEKKKKPGDPGYVPGAPQ